MMTYVGLVVDGNLVHKFTSDVPDIQVLPLGTSNEIIREQISLKSGELERYLLRLRLFHNATLPVNGLPSELLSEIFCLAKSSSRKMDWIGLTHVCHHWREVALSTPLLWTTISMENGLPCVRTCLQRSGDAPIVFTSRSYTESIQPLLNIILPHIHKMRALKLWALSASAADAFIPYLKEPMPYLEDLALHVQSGRMQALPHHLTLTSGQLPYLRSLSLKRVNIASFPAGTMALVLLELCDVLATSPTPVETLLNLLDNCQRLEVVTISERDHRLPGKAIPHEHTAHSVSLPKLQMMKLSAHTSVISGLLSCLTIPDDARLEVRCTDDVGGTLQNPISAAFARGIASLTNLKAVNSLYLFVSSNIFRIRAWDEGVVSTKKLDMEFDCDPPMDMSSLLPRALRELAQVFASSAVTNLQISGDYGLLTSRGWRDALANFMGIERLEIGSRGNANALFQSLCTPPDEAFLSAGLLCPQLRKLHISGATLDEETVGLMSTVVGYRLSQGQQLETLALTNTSCKEHFKNDYVKSVAAAVGTFVHT